MAALIASVCCTLIILGFCQVIVETILPEGGTKKYVVLISGIVAVLAIVTVFTSAGSDIMKTVYQKTADMKSIEQKNSSQGLAGDGSNPYQEYIEKLISAYK